MKNLISYVGIIVVVSFMAVSCDSAINSSNNSNSELESIANSTNSNSSASVLSACQSAGTTGKTAVYVNQSVNNATIDFDSHSCDMAIYFDENAPKNAVVRNTTIIQETGNSGEVYGLWNNGGEVTVTRSVFTTDFSGQYIPIRFDEGAQGTISSNELTGTHRSAMVIRGQRTNANIKGNSVIGVGPKKSGWGQNGIQVDERASAKIVNNEIIGHWYEDSGTASTGLFLFGASYSIAINNTFHNNEVSVVLYGNDNEVKGSQTSSDIFSQSSAYGAWISGSDNHLAGNSFSSADGTGDIGVLILSGSNSKVTGNKISGFNTPVIDGGNETLIKGLPTAGGI